MTSFFTSAIPPQPDDNMKGVLEKMDLMDNAIKTKRDIYDAFMNDLNDIVGGLDGTFKNIQLKIQDVNKTTSKITNLEKTIKDISEKITAAEEKAQKAEGNLLASENLNKKLDDENQKNTDRLNTLGKQKEKYESELTKLKTRLDAQLTEINNLFSDPYSKNWGEVKRILSEYKKLSLEGSTGGPSNFNGNVNEIISNEQNGIELKSFGGGRKRRGKRATKKVMKGGWMTTASQRNRRNIRSSLSRPSKSFGFSSKSRKAYSRSR